MQKRQDFHAFTLKYDGIADRIITEVRISAAFDPANPPDQLPPQIKTRALWDTGATKSVVTPAAVQKMGLVPIGTSLQKHAGGESQCNVYLVNFLLPNNVGIAGVMASDCVDTHQFEAIVGMDIIARGDFSLTHAGGKTTVSYRFPSIRCIDYVEEANKIKFAGVGRNDLCPCGALDKHGKRLKFKNCHGK